jgi:hypothetical protein
MTDIATLAHDAFDATVNALFTDVTEKKMYVTGGLGADGRTEAFGAEYALPNKAYAETCASIGGILWYHRLFLKTGQEDHYDRPRADALQRVSLGRLALGGSILLSESPRV